MWVYGSGFPKSLNVSKAIERMEVQAIERMEVQAIERRFCNWVRTESGLTPEDFGTDRFHECRVEVVNTATKDAPAWGRRALVPTFSAWERLRPKVVGRIPDWVGECVKNPPKPPIEHPGQWKSGRGKGTLGLNEWSGWGTALKPAWEPIIVARKPLIGTVAANVLKHGTGAMNIDGCRVGAAEGRPHRIGDYKATDNNAYQGRMDGSLAGGSRAVGETNQGRWPANLVHDGSDEVVSLFPAQKSGANPTRRGSPKFRNAYGEFTGQEECEAQRGAESGSAARFFYCAKASKADRGQENKHPTVKPTDLMRYLCRLVTPPGGVVLDPFMGSGSTGKAAVLEGFRFIGIECEAEYIEIARSRIHGASEHPKQAALL